MRRLALPALAALALGAAGALAACGDSGPTLTVYSGREEGIVGPLLEGFEKETGIDVEVRYGDSAELAATISEEGGNSPADVFFAQDAGSLGSIVDRLAPLPAATLDRVPAQLRDPEGHWVGTSGRVRVVAYNTETYKEGDLPDAILDYVDPRFRNRVGIAPTNASFQAFVTGMRLSLGDERTREWLTALKDNGAKVYEKNLQIVEAVASGEVDLGLVNHYYLYLHKKEQPDAPVANRFMRAGDPGGLVNVAGAGVLASSDDAEDANRFVEYLLSEEGQRFYVEEAREAEYPVAAGVKPAAGLPPLSSLKGPDVPLESLGGELEETLEMLSEVGLTS
ncbi:MAG: iron ABC transporter substrate-binding protein [Actinomycetota bacterium]